LKGLKEGEPKKEKKKKIKLVVKKLSLRRNGGDKGTFAEAAAGLMA